jgi:hypothetical protein
METKTNALVIAVFALTFLVIAVIYKSKSDRKRKSMSLTSAEGEKNSYVYVKEPRSKKKNLWGIPSWVLALLTMFLALFVLMFVGSFVAEIFNIPDESPAEWVFYMLYNLIIAGGGYLICRHNPKSVWYVPVLSNLIGIYSAIDEPNFWISSLWIVICGGWILTIIASIMGAMKGRKQSAPEAQ